MIVPHLSFNNKSKWSFVFWVSEFVYFKAHSFICHTTYYVTTCIIKNKEIAFKDLFEDFCQHDWKENVYIESSNFTLINHLKYTFQLKTESTHCINGGHLWRMTNWNNCRKLKHFNISFASMLYVKYVSIITYNRRRRWKKWERHFILNVKSYDKARFTRYFNGTAQSSIKS